MAPAVAPALRRSLHRWVYLLLGGAIGLAVALVLAWPVTVLTTTELPWLLVGPAILVVCTAPVAAVGVLGQVRPIEGAAVEALLTGRPEDRPGPATTGRQRGRTALLLVLHVLAGVVAGALLVIGLPTAATLVADLDATGAPPLPGVAFPAGAPARLLVAAGLVAATVLVGDLLGRGLARLAPRLLAGPTAERLAAAEASVSVLTGRDRLARELHDSVGHALSLASVQAGAARRLLVRDPAAAEQAIRATEDATRRALVDLDHVLGLLRDEDGAPGGTAPVPDLRDLDALVATASGAGAEVAVEVTGPVGGLPAVVSREAYRIVQEGLTNVLRHAPGASCRVRVDAAGDELELRVANDVPGSAGGSPGGSRGLLGIRERVRDLRGSVSAGTDDDGRWLLVARLPVHARGAAR